MKKNIKKKYVNPKDFWDNKILKWEENRYSKIFNEHNPLEFLARNASNSLRFRLDYATKILEKNVINKKVVEFGCGSGLLAEKIISLGAKEYIGYDISDKAINYALNKAKKSNYSKSIYFKQGSISSISKIDADINFSLGLTDWLDDNLIKKLFKLTEGRDFLHSFSEKRSSLANLAHRTYVYLAYGYKSGAYIPRYYNAKDLQKIGETFGLENIYFHRHKKLSFGTIISSLNNKTFL